MFCFCFCIMMRLFFSVISIVLFIFCLLPSVSLPHWPGTHTSSRSGFRDWAWWRPTSSRSLFHFYSLLPSEGSNYLHFMDRYETLEIIFVYKDLDIYFVIKAVKDYYLSFEVPCHKIKEFQLLFFHYAKLSEFIELEYSFYFILYFE